MDEKKKADKPKVEKKLWRCTRCKYEHKMMVRVPCPQCGHAMASV